MAVAVATSAGLITARGPHNCRQAPGRGRPRPASLYSWWSEQQRCTMLVTFIAEFLIFSVLHAPHVADLLSGCTEGGSSSWPYYWPEAQQCSETEKNELAPSHPALATYPCGAPMHHKILHLCANTSLLCLNPWLWIRVLDFSWGAYLVSVNGTSYFTSASSLPH